MKSSWRRVRTGLTGKTATQPDPFAPDEEADERESGPQRRCLVTRAHGPKEQLLRFVAGPDGMVVFDVLATLPGRGMWLSPRRDVIEKACRSGVFARAARRSVGIPPDFTQRIEAALNRRFLELLGLARRSGAAVAGFDKGREWLAHGKAALVVQAVDGSAEERSRFAGHTAIPVVTGGSAAALGTVFGRERCVHVVLAPGRLAHMVEIAAARLSGVAGGAASGQ